MARSIPRSTGRAWRSSDIRTLYNTPFANQRPAFVSSLAKGASAGRRYAVFAPHVTAPPRPHFHPKSKECPAPLCHVQHGNLQHCRLCRWTGATMGRDMGIDSDEAATPADPSDPDAVRWHPVSLLRNAKHQTTKEGAETQGGGKDRFALIVLNQPITSYLGIIGRLWRNAFTHIAADGGANCLYEAAGQRGDKSFDNLRVIIGDLDSLSDETRNYYKKTSCPTKTEVVYVADQNSTDFGKAVNYVRDTHGLPVDIVAVGGLGGRVDQGLSQLHHLYLFQTHPRYDEGRMYFFSGESLTFLLKAGSHQIRVREDGRSDVFDKWVGILPVKEPSRITTKGLEWDVTDWETEFGGQISTSNHILPETQLVHVHSTKDVLFTVALKRL